jgi:cytoskeletal protein RodZ
MRKQVFILLTILALTAFGVLMAQTPNPSSLPPSQQVDQSGKPETGPGPDVDVDTGKNASNGVLDVQVNPKTDSDTSAKGPSNTGTTPGVHPETEHGTGVDVDVDTGKRANGAVDVDVTRTTDADTTANENEKGMHHHRALPGTASELPLVAMMGLLALGAAFALRAIRRNA